jgi:hypothetical protein
MQWSAIHSLLRHAALRLHRNVMATQSVGQADTGAPRASDCVLTKKKR